MTETLSIPSSTLISKSSCFPVEGNKGELNICISMALGYVADYVVDGAISSKEATQTLKDMIKEETERRGNGTWL